MIFNFIKMESLQGLKPLTCFNSPRSIFILIQAGIWLNPPPAPVSHFSEVKAGEYLSLPFNNFNIRIITLSPGFLCFLWGKHKEMSYQLVIFCWYLYIWKLAKFNAPGVSLVTHEPILNARYFDISFRIDRPKFLSLSFKIA